MLKENGLPSNQCQEELQRQLCKRLSSMWREFLRMSSRLNTINPINISVSQERFLLRGKSNPNDTTDYRWWVPLTYTTDFQTTKSVWLADNQTMMQLPNINGNSNSWIIFNVGQVG